MNFPYLLGVELAVNAIPDAHLLVDASDCIMAIPEFHKNHDLNTTLLNPSGAHRVYHTGADVHGAANNRTSEISDSIREMLQSGRVKNLFFTSTPMTAITGYQYDKIIRSAVEPDKNIPVIEVPRKGLLGDWLDGYSDTLEAMATHLDFTGKKTDAGTIALVGYFMDRTEEDHKGNLRELRRIIEDGLELKLATIWMENEPFSKTTDISGAEKIVALPYGGAAGKIIAEKTGAALIETSLPFGIDGTKKWIMRIAESCGATDMAEKFIDAELKNIIPTLEWAVKKWFMGKKIVFCGDPYAAEGVKTLVEELGCRFEAGAIFAEASKSRADSMTGACAVRTGEFIDRIKESESKVKTDLFIANSIAGAEIRSALGENAPIMEFGYPSYSYHALFDSPFLGFRGAMSFLNRMAATVIQ